MSRTRSLLIALLLIALALPLGLVSTSAQDDTAEISFMGWGQPSEQAVFEALIAAFEEENPNVKVDYVNIPPGEFLQRLTTLAAAGDLPDVFYMSPDWFATWVSRSQLLAIEEYVPEEELADIWPMGLDFYRYDGEVTGRGTLYCLPKDLGPFVMVYNKDLFDKHGVPYPPTDGSWTWDKALEDYQALTEFADDGSVISFGVGFLPPEAAIWSNGADFLNEDRTKVTVDDPLFTEAIQWLADLSNVHHVKPNQADLASQSDWEMWLAGKLATHVMGPWDQPTFWELPFNWDIGVFPSSPRTMQPAGWTGSMGFAVSAKTKHPEEAVALVRYFSTNEEGQRMNYQMGQAVPNIISMAEGEFLEFEKDPQSRYVFLDNIREWGHPLPSTYVSNNLWMDTMWQELAPVWNGEMTAEEWADEWAEELTRLLNDEDQIRSVPLGNPLPKVE